MPIWIPEGGLTRELSTLLDVNISADVQQDEMEGDKKEEVVLKQEYPLTKTGGVSTQNRMSCRCTESLCCWRIDSKTKSCIPTEYLQCLVSWTPLILPPPAAQCQQKRTCRFCTNASPYCVECWKFLGLQNLAWPQVYDLWGELPWYLLRPPLHLPRHHSPPLMSPSSTTPTASLQHSANWNPLISPPPHSSKKPTVFLLCPTSSTSLISSPSDTPAAPSSSPPALSPSKRACDYVPLIRHNM